MHNIVLHSKCQDLYNRNQTGSKQEKFRFQTNGRTDRQTEGQVHLLSCAFAAKNVISNEKNHYSFLILIFNLNCQGLRYIVIFMHLIRLSVEAPLEVINSVLPSSKFCVWQSFSAHWKDNFVKSSNLTFFFIVPFCRSYSHWKHGPRSFGTHCMPKECSKCGLSSLEKCLVLSSTETGTNERKQFSFQNKQVCD